MEKDIDTEEKLLCKNCNAVLEEIDSVLSGGEYGGQWRRRFYCCECFKIWITPHSTIYFKIQI